MRPAKSINASGLPLQVPPKPSRVALGRIDIQGIPSCLIADSWSPVIFARSGKMAVKRYELSEAQWMKVAPLLPGKIERSRTHRV
jgi:hypothetical protein